MTTAPSTPRSPVSASAQNNERLFNELADLTFLTLNFCTSEAQLQRYGQLAEEKGVALGQIVAAALTGTILQHYEVQPKPDPTEFSA